MAHNGKEKGLFGEAFKFPRPLTEADIMAQIEQANRLMQNVERAYVGQKRIEVPVLTKQPIDLILWGDLHLLSLSTDADQIDKTIQWILNNPNAALILMGDELEGIKDEYKRTNRTIATYQQMEDLLVYKISPIAQQGKLLTFIRDYWGHNGWADTGKGPDPWLRLSREWGVPQLQTGGELVLRWKDGITWEMLLWHNPPGASKVDPVRGLREVSLMTDISKRARLYSSAHLHREGIGSELQPGDEIQRYFISVGTPKGSNPDKPKDGFIVRIGKGNQQASRSGQGIVIYRTDDKHDKGVAGAPFHSLEEGEKLGIALGISDDAESTGKAREIVEKTLASKKDPKFTQLKGSRVSTSPSIELTQKLLKQLHPDLNEDEEGTIPEAEYSRAYGDLVIPPLEYRRGRPSENDSPNVVFGHQNIRFGSTSEGSKELEEFRREYVDNNPLAYEVIGRNYYDKDAGGKPDRNHTLKRGGSLMKDIGERGIGFLLDSSLRKKAWTNPVGKDKKILIPATYLAETSGIPPLQNMAIVEFVFGNDLVYPIGIVDKLMNSGSLSNSAFGLLQMYYKHMSTKPYVLIGGHMPSAGWTSLEDAGNIFTDYPIVIQPGSYAKTFDGLGGGNRSKGAKPGQGFIMMPGKKQSDAWVIPFGDASAYRDLFTALILYDEIVRKGAYPKYRKELERKGIIPK